MRRSRIALTALLALVAATAYAQVKDYHQLKYPALHPFTVPQPERSVLGNGMVVMLIEDHELPLIEVTARIRTGSRLEPAGKVGLAGIVGEVMRTGGTKSMTGDQMEEFLESRAAEIETNIGEDSGRATLSCLAKDFPDVLKVYADVLRNPIFDEAKLKIAKNEINASIARRNDNPQGVMNREFDKLVYGGDSPYARRPEYATVEAIKRDDLIDFHKTYVQPNRIILGVVGDFDAKEMASKLKAAFGDWPAGPAAKDAEASYQTSMKAGVYYVQKEDMTQSDIIMGHLGIRRDNPDFFAVEVLNEAFGGSFAARLFSNVRSKKGLAYSVRGAVGADYDHPGTFDAWMTTKTETTAAGIDALLTEIDDIVAHPPDDKEVRRAKDSILNSFVFNFDSKLKILNQQITYEYFGFPSDYLARYRENIDKVTMADVARVAKKYIHKDQLAILVVGPSKGQDRPLDSFGKVTKLDIAIPEPAGPSAPAASAESLAKGKTLFAKVVEGLGGGAAVDAVKAVRSVSNTTVKTPQGELAIKVVSLLALPDRVRQELTTPMGQMVRVVAGSEGFMSTPMGVQAMPDSQRADMAKSARRQSIALAQHRNDPDLKVQHLGSETVDGAQAETLLVSLGGEDVRLTVDAATGRILRQAYRGQGQGGPGDFLVTYSDFRPVSGLTLPFKSESLFNGQPQQSTVTQEVVVNPEVDAALFAKPGSTSASDTQK